MPRTSRPKSNESSKGKCFRQSLPSLLICTVYLSVLMLIIGWIDAFVGLVMAMVLMVLHEPLHYVAARALGEPAEMDMRNFQVLTNATGRRRAFIALVPTPVHVVPLVITLYLQLFCATLLVLASLLGCILDWKDALMTLRNRSNAFKKKR